jgi:hypothetical protein
MHRNLKKKKTHAAKTITKLYLKLKQLTLSSGLPRNLTARKTGQKRRISFIQLPSVDFGATTI